MNLSPLLARSSQPQNNLNSLSMGNRIEESSAAPLPVTPAEANDLGTAIRQILSGHLNETSLEQTAEALETVIKNAPTRITLPEIKLHSEPKTATEEAPSISFDREGDTVKRVQIQCTCGQSIHLDCIY